MFCGLSEKISDKTEQAGFQPSSFFTGHSNFVYAVIKQQMYICVYGIKNH